MRWAADESGSEWTATVSRDALIRVIRRTLRPSYREGEDPREEFETVVFTPDEALGLAAELNAAADAACDGVPE